MRLRHGLHLAYCTNIHRGESWPQTLENLRRFTLDVRRQVAPSEAYAIGLRLSARAARELAEPSVLNQFQQWLADENCYVFTINGFPYGSFHGTRVKENVYLPDWTSTERLEYTVLLFQLLAQLLPGDAEGSVSTVPCSFKEFIHTEDQEKAMRANLWRCVERIEQICDRTGKRLHLGLEPEPLCVLETSDETVRFFEALRRDRRGDERLNRFLGVNYDTCHLAVEFEEPRDVIRRFRENGIRISKLHLSAALKLAPTPDAIRVLHRFLDDVYFHQVIVRRNSGEIVRHRDLDTALAASVADENRPGDEWRIHFHIPLNRSPEPPLKSTSDHILGVMDALAADPALCSHLEMETYTWEVLPPDLKNLDVVEHLAAEYRWTLDQLGRRGLVVGSLSNA